MVIVSIFNFFFILVYDYCILIILAYSPNNYPFRLGFSIQIDDRSGNINQLSKEVNIVDLSNLLKHYGDTAVAIEQLDLVISVDTSVVHLAGALGKPVWTALCYNPDWRWLLDREDSPWYPTMRLFRQSQPQDWQSVFVE